MNVSVFEVRGVTRIPCSIRNTIETDSLTAQHHKKCVDYLELQNLAIPALG